MLFWRNVEYYCPLVCRSLSPLGYIVDLQLGPSLGSISHSFGWQFYCEKCFQTCGNLFIFVFLYVHISIVTCGNLMFLSSNMTPTHIWTQNVTLDKRIILFNLLNRYGFTWFFWYRVELLIIKHVLINEHFQIFF